MMNIGDAPRINGARLSRAKHARGIARTRSDPKRAAKISPRPARQKPKLRRHHSRFKYSVGDFVNGAVAAARYDEAAARARFPFGYQSAFARARSESAVEGAEVRGQSV